MGGLFRSHVVHEGRCPQSQQRVVKRARVERGSQFYCRTLQYNSARSLMALLPPPCILDTVHYCELKPALYEQCRFMG